MDDIYRKTPIMGWASWNCFRTDIDEEKIKRQADALVSTGLLECGYEYLNIDDGFFGGRNSDGRLMFHKKRFPNGIKIIADYAHLKGLKAGIYSDGGDMSCGFFYDGEGMNGTDVGLYGHEEQDLSMYLEEFGFDFIKVDWCGGVRLGLDDRKQYTKIAGIIDNIRKRTGRSIVFNICRWRFPGEWAVDIADSWRTGADITNDFDSVIHQLDRVKCLVKYTRPGHVNDLDMMQIGNGLTLTEEKTHFGMWCMMSTPLMIGCDLTSIRHETLEVLKNKELIELNQDSLCAQAYVIKEIRDENGRLSGEIWMKKLGTKGQRALAFLNRCSKELTMRITLHEAGYKGEVTEIRDLWAHRNIECKDVIECCLDAHDSAIFRITGENPVETEDVNSGMVFESDYDYKPNRISWKKVKKLISEGALLVDVRSAQEYERNHIRGAVNIPHTSVFKEIEKYAPDKKTPVIVYCTTGKRCDQAKLALEYLYYDELYTFILNLEPESGNMGCELC